LLLSDPLHRARAAHGAAEVKKKKLKK